MVLKKRNIIYQSQRLALHVTLQGKPYDRLCRWPKARWVFGGLNCSAIAQPNSPKWSYNHLMVQIAREDSQLSENNSKFAAKDVKWGTRWVLPAQIIKHSPAWPGSTTFYPPFGNHNVVDRGLHKWRCTRWIQFKFWSWVIFAGWCSDEEQGVSDLRQWCCGRRCVQNFDCTYRDCSVSACACACVVL